MYIAFLTHIIYNVLVYCHLQHLNILFNGIQCFHLPLLFLLDDHKFGMSAVCENFICQHMVQELHIHFGIHRLYIHTKDIRNSEHQPQVQLRLLVF